MTVFKMNDGLTEWLVMPFGLTNSPRTFARLMNEVLKLLLIKFIIVYLDYIWIFIMNKEEHLEHVRKVLFWLKQENILINLKQCTFLETKLVYLEFLISKDGLKKDPKKVKDIVDWATCQSNFGMGSFHGLASFYRKFIHNFSKICEPLTNCMMKGTIKWIEATMKEFVDMKRRWWRS